MRFVLYAAIAGLVLYVLVMAWRMVRFVLTNKKADKVNQPYFQDGKAEAKHILVIGDSTMYGAGIKDRQQTIGGLLAAKYPGASVETRAVNGARIGDIQEQLDLASYDRYDVVLLGVGGNDVVSFTDYGQAADDLKQLLTKLNKLSKLTVLCHSVNVGNVGFFLFPFNRLFDYRSRRLSEMYARVAVPFPNVRYLNFYRPLGDDHYDRRTRKLFLSDDSFHPNEYANRYFFELIWQAIKEGRRS